MPPTGQHPMYCTCESCKAARSEAHPWRQRIAGRRERSERRQLPEDIRQHIHQDGRIGAERLA